MKIFKFTQVFTIDAQKNDKELQENIQLIKDGVKSEFSVKEDENLYFRDRLCVPANSKLKKELLHEAQNSVFTMHPGGHKMY